eukprot:2210496-Rhodomonas_salina.1
MEERSVLGKLGLRLVSSRTWEALFLLFIVFMAGIKTTEHREQSQGQCQSMECFRHVVCQESGKKEEGTTKM